MKLKVCGMKYPDNMMDVGMLKPDYMGFIFYEQSHRYFNGEIPDLPKQIKKIGVFVDAPFTDITKTIEKHRLHGIQLHGHESPAFCKAFSEFNVPIIKVFNVDRDFDFSVIKAYEDVCDYFLFDTKGKLPGGNGYTFDWHILETYPSSKPYFLSGGIGLKDLEKLKAFLASKSAKFCHAIDVNSQFETKPGLKNLTDLEQFIHEL
ncbi:phosphoribosylanthranilate isomerase [Psychroserpens sp. BH13MA-6]